MTTTTTTFLYSDSSREKKAKAKGIPTSIPFRPVPVFCKHINVYRFWLTVYHPVSFQIPRHRVVSSLFVCECDVFDLLSAPSLHTT
jgi:hypothetical protein